MSDQPGTTVCPCCGNWKMYDAPRCHDCYQDDLIKAINVLKELLLVISEDENDYPDRQLFLMITKATIKARDILSEIDDVKLYKKSKLTFNDLP